MKDPKQDGKRAAKWTALAVLGVIILLATVFAVIFVLLPQAPPTN